jgi:hypothetical protein
MRNVFGSWSSRKDEMLDSELSKGCALIGDDLGDTAGSKVIVNQGNFQEAVLKGKTGLTATVGRVDRCRRSYFSSTREID